jgi:hypothetical protein
MALTPDLIYALLACGVMLLVGFPIHEACHAWTAWRLGDSTARWQGRITLDPRVHTDRTGAILLVMTAVLSGGTMFFGYARPTPVNPVNLRYGRRGEALVAAAGPVSNIVMALIVALAIRVAALVLGLPTDGPVHWVEIVLVYVVIINITLFVFNLVPMPPLDGWRVVLGLVSPRLAYQLRMIEARYAAMLPIVFLIAVLILLPPILRPIFRFLYDLILGGVAGL